MSSGRLPVIEVDMGGVAVNALVDTGCTTTMVRAHLVRECEADEKETYMVAFDGRQVKCSGTCLVKLVVAERQVEVCAIVVDEVVEGIDVVMGIDIIDQLGGVAVCKGTVRFGGDMCLASVSPESAESSMCEINDRDFQAVFNGDHWTVKWCWKGDSPPSLRNKVSCYDKQLDGRKKEEFEKEVDRWIAEGILVPWGKEVEGGILPLMAVEQPTKNKVRPVLDYRELNEYVECHTGDNMTDVCNEVLREWRQMEGEVKLVDLKSAYLQIRVARELWKYQLVKYKGKTYCLTRWGFGLNCAPRIMTSILKTVLRKSERVEKATSSYIDDILVKVLQTTVLEVVEHLKKFGLITKAPESLDGGAALGLKLRVNERGVLDFFRGNEIPDIPECLTRRDLFSICGKLIGHYPIAGWLRVSCSYVKRTAEGSSWDDYVGDRTIAMVREMLDRVKRDDPVKGSWAVPKTSSGLIWCDASSIAMGVLVEKDNMVVEDAAWLRKKTDFNHINVAELEAVLKGVNLGLKWGLKQMDLMTDSAAVYGWVKLILTGDKRVRTKGAAEMIVKRRLGILKDLVEEFDLRVNINLVSTLKNKADVLTRVKKNWLHREDDDENDDRDVCAGAMDLRKVHDMHHMGVERSLFQARKLDPTVTRQAVRSVVRSCSKCQSIDPAPVSHEKGEIGVRDNWKRLAIDVTHYRQVPYLSIVDCGPGRFAIWRELKRETAECIAAVMEEIFLERGPVDEVLMDNATAFRSELLRELLDRWKVRPFYRNAYRADGNGIVERHHRTIKAMAERGGIRPQEAVFWYNTSPRSGQSEDSVPQQALFRYEWRHPALQPYQESNEREARVTVGEEVWVKPPNARCTTQWQKGRVTRINSRNNISVDGMPRHILDIRRVILPSESVEENAEEGEEQEEEALLLEVANGDADWEREAAGMQEEEAVLYEVANGDAEREREAAEMEQRHVENKRQYPGRRRRPPRWMEDYVEDYKE